MAPPGGLIRRFLCRVLGHRWTVPMIGMSGVEYAICERCDTERVMGRPENTPDSWGGL